MFPVAKSFDSHILYLSLYLKQYGKNILTFLDIEENIMNFKQSVVVGIIFGFCFTVLGIVGDGSKPDLAERKAAIAAEVEHVSG